MTVRSVFFFGVGRREGRHNGVESSGVLFFLAHPERTHKRGGIPAREKGVSSTCGKKPAGQINDLVSVPISGVTVLLFFFTVISIDPLSFPYTSRCLLQTGIA